MKKRKVLRGTAIWFLRLPLFSPQAHSSRKIIQVICEKEIERIHLRVILGENSMTHERLHWQSEVQKQQLQSEQHPEEINFTFMWSVTILLFVLLIWWFGVMLPWNAPSYTKIIFWLSAKFLLKSYSENTHWSPFIWNIICISVTRFCWIAASC